MKSLVGKKFGKLTVIEKTDKRNKNGTIIWKCLCDCGNISHVSTDSLNNGHSKSCGCVREEKFNEYRDNNKNDLTGMRFGRLVVKKYVRTDKNGKAIWLCRCDCGNEKEILGESLVNGNTKSCGCISSENIKMENKKNCVDGSNVAIVKGIVRDGKSKITKSGVKGVGWDKRKGKWRSYIMFRGKYYHLGYFEYEELDKAIEVRRLWEGKLFGEFIEELGRLEGKQM